MGKIKICGLKDLEMLEVAIEMKTDFIGFVFFEKSPRYLSLELAAHLATQARGRTKIVALVVNADNMALGRIKAAVHPDYFQLHGQETHERMLDIRKRFNTPLIKALGVETADDIYIEKQADFMLLDAKAPANAHLPGGNGKSFNWSILKKLDLPPRTMLSGGLTPDNVYEAIKETRLHAVDVSSGVETAPGIKSAEKIRQFITTARQAFKEFK